MTEVTSVRELVWPRPLGLLKDNVEYCKLTSRFANSKEKSEKDREKPTAGNIRNSQKVMKGALQQATLINIVAAVNETFGDEHSASSKDNVEPGSPADALSNNMAVVSSIISPRERTISIPTTHVLFEMPIETIQKKPVYYKHSEDEEVHRKDSNARLFSKNSKEKLKINSPKPYIVSENVMKRLQVREPGFDHNCDKLRQKPDSETQKNSVGPSWTPVRRLGAWKRPQSRTIHKLSKCEAVDIMDSDSIRRPQTELTLNPDPTKVTAEEKLKIIPPSPVNPYPFYRAKSLPAVLPVKTTKQTSLTQTMEPHNTERYRNRPLTRGYFSQSSETKRMFNLSGSARFEHSNNDELHKRETVSPYKLDVEKNKDAQKSQFSLAGSDDSPAEVRGKAFGQGSLGYGIITLQNSFEISQSKENIYQGIKTLTQGGQPRTTHSSASSRSQSSNAAFGKKGCLANKSGPGEFLPGRRTPKRVKFARRPSSNSATLDDEPIAKINAFGGSSIVQTPTASVTAYSPGPEPLSAQELLRLKQKFIPANVQVELSHKPTYNFSHHDGMRIKSIHHRKSEREDENKTPVNNDSDNHGSDIFDSDKVDSDVLERELEFSMSKDKDKSDDRSDTLTDVRTESDDKLRRLVCEDDESDSDSEEEFSQLAAKHELSYKLVKAVDLDSYAEFEHKKMRKVLNSSLNRNENAKAQFVTMKLREGE